MHGGGGGVTNSGAGGEKRALEREALRNVIAQWNANRLDLFELSEPNEVRINNYNLPKHRRSPKLEVLYVKITEILYVR